MRPLGRRPGIQHHALLWIPASRRRGAPRNDSFRMDTRAFASPKGLRPRSRVKPAYDADVLKLPARSAADAVLDHPGSQQPVAGRAAVPAVVGIFPDLRADAAGEPDAWRVL